MAARGDAEFKLNFTAGDTNAVTQQVAQMFNAMTRESRKTATAVGGIQSTFNKLVRSMQYALGSYVGVGAIVGVMRAIGAAQSEYIKKNASFQRDIGQLMAQGSNATIENSKNMKREVAITTSSLGISSKAAADFIYNLQSGVEGLQNAPQVFRDIRKEAIQLTQLKGGDINTFTTAMTKAYHNFGAEVGNANLLQNKFFKTVEEGAIEMENFAQFAPVAFESAGALGVGLDETLATIISATQRGASSQDVMTGVKNMMAIMSQKDRVNLVNQKMDGPDLELSGSYMDKLEQIRAWNEQQGGEGIVELFGQETFRTANSVLEALDLIVQRTKELKSMTPIDDMVGERMLERIKNDPGFLEGKASDANQAILANPAEFGQGYKPDSWWAKLGQNYDAGKVHAAVATGGAFGGVGEFFGGIAGMLSPEYAMVGKLQTAEGLGGRTTEAGRAYLLKIWQENHERRLAQVSGSGHDMMMAGGTGVYDPKKLAAVQAETPSERLFSSKEEHQKWVAQYQTGKFKEWGAKQTGSLKTKGAILGGAVSMIDPAYDAVLKLSQTGQLDMNDPVAVQKALSHAEAQLALMEGTRNTSGVSTQQVSDPQSAVSAVQAGANYYGNKGKMWSRAWGANLKGSGATGLAFVAADAASNADESSYAALTDKIERLTNALERNSETLASQRTSRIPGGSRANSAEAQ